MTCARCQGPGPLTPVRYRDVSVGICATCLQALSNERLGRDEQDALDEFDARLPRRGPAPIIPRAVRHDVRWVG